MERDGEGRDDVVEGMFGHSDCNPYINWLKETVELHPSFFAFDKVFIGMSVTRKYLRYANHCFQMVLASLVK